MRIGIAVDYGKYANAYSLNLIARKVFLEMGKVMNKKRNFTVTALKYEDVGLGDVNQHFDCISIPNMGGYKFPHQGTLTSNNLSIGIVGIDEVILGESVYKSKEEWKINRPIIEREKSRWEKYVDRIRFIHASTNSDKEQMIKHLKIPEDKIHVIPFGVDHENFKPPIDKDVERKKILSRFFIKNSPYFIHVSEVNWARKNVLRILEAFEKAKSEGIKHNLIIVGKIEPIIREKASSVRGVIVLGFVSEEDLIALLQGADALILPSLHEGFGLPLVEAMACGVPAITSNVFSPPEVVGDTGLLVDPYDVLGIAKKMMEISRNKKLQETLSVAALERSKKFSWEYTADKLLKLIEENTDHGLDNFNESLDLSAYRTLVTVCEILPGLRDIAQQDLLKFDYSRIIPWAINVGLKNNDVKEYLLPFKDWLISNSK